jgi:hypothetical protein
MVAFAMEFCDLTCKHARWPEDVGLDGSGSCRTFQAVFCEKKQRTVHKNAPCDKKEGRSGGGIKRGLRVPK